MLDGLDWGMVSYILSIYLFIYLFYRGICPIPTRPTLKHTNSPNMFSSVPIWDKTYLA